MARYEGPRYTREWYLAVNGFEDGTPEADEAWAAKESFEASKSRLQIVPDMAGYVSVVDGSVVSSRRDQREHIKRHDLVEVGNERMPAPTFSMPSVGQDIKRTLEQLGSR